MRKCAKCNWPYALFVHGQALYFVRSINMTKVHLLFFMKGPDHIRVGGTICRTSDNCMRAKSRTGFSGIHRCTYWWSLSHWKVIAHFLMKLVQGYINFFAHISKFAYLEIWVLAPFSSRKNAVVRYKKFHSRIHAAAMVPKWQ